MPRRCPVRCREGLNVREGDWGRSTNLAPLLEPRVRVFRIWEKPRCIYSETRIDKHQLRA